jgi:hypothetical protein
MELSIPVVIILLYISRLYIKLITFFLKSTKAKLRNRARGVDDCLYF